MFGLSDFIMYNLFHCLFSLSLPLALYFIFSLLFYIQSNFFQIHQKTYTNVAISLMLLSSSSSFWMCMYTFVLFSFWLLLCIFYSFFYFSSLWRFSSLVLLEIFSIASSSPVIFQMRIDDGKAIRGRKETRIFARRKRESEIFRSQRNDATHQFVLRSNQSKWFLDIFMEKCAGSSNSSSTKSGQLMREFFFLPFVCVHLSVFLFYGRSVVVVVLLFCCLLLCVLRAQQVHFEIFVFIFVSHSTYHICLRILVVLPI